MSSEPLREPDRREPPSSTDCLEGDRAWLDGYRAGERAALGRIFRAYVDDVARTVRAGVRVKVDGQPTRLSANLDELEVENLVQETFLKAFGESARAGYDGVRPFGAYLATIARNLMIDRGRQRVREGSRLVHDERLEENADEQQAHDPEQQAEARELEGLLERFRADELSEEERDLFRLRYDEQLSQAAAAKEMGMSEVQVRRRDSSVRARLLSFLRAHGWLEKRKVAIGTSLLKRRASR